MRTSVGIGFVGLAVLMACAQADAATVEVGSAIVSPGGSATITVVLRTEGQSVKGVVNEVVFSAVTPIVACVVNPAFAATATVRFLPDECQAGVDCNKVRAVFAPFTGTIPDATELYVCTVTVANDAAPAQHELGCQNAAASDPDGMPLTAACSSGFVDVEAAGCLGDKDGSGSIEATDVVATILCFAQDDISLNPAADGSNNDSCDATEVVQVIGNFANDECNPFHE